MWKKKEEVEELKEIKKVIEEPTTVEESLEELEQEQKRIEQRVKELALKKQDSTLLNKQEVIDIVQGSLNRIASLVEILRRS